MRVKKRKWLRWILGVSGALVLGALGSGLWTVLFAPLGSLLIRAALSIVTLGISAAKDSIYARAALGFTENPSITLLLLVGTFVLSLPVLLFIGLRLTLGDQRSRPKPEDELAAEIKKLRRRLSLLTRGIYILLVFQAFIGVIFFVQILMMVYTNQVIASFQQTLAIVALHISSEQRTMYAARFAKVQNRQDFVVLFDELNSVAEKNGEKRSKFVPW